MSEHAQRLDALRRAIKLQHLGLMAAAVAGQEAIKALQAGKEETAALHLTVMVMAVCRLEPGLTAEMNREAPKT